MPRILRFVLLTLFLLPCSAPVFAGEALWIDVRSADEYAGNHVSIAHNIPYTEIADRISELTDDKGAEIYVYCRSGRRSGIAKSTLEDMGFSKVVNLGGFKSAQQAAASMNICPEANPQDC